MRQLYLSVRTLPNQVSYFNVHQVCYSTPVDHDALRHGKREGCCLEAYLRVVDYNSESSYGSAARTYCFDVNVSYGYDFSLRACCSRSANWDVGLDTRYVGPAM
jgi:hypothetical protein